MRKGFPAEIQDWLRLRGRSVVLALDYDGTLVPIFQKPEDSSPDSELVNLLRELAQEGTVAILTGRDRKDMERWLPDPAIVIVASHGAEWRHSGLWKPLLIPHRNQGPLKILTKKLEEVFGETPGVIIEDKGATVAFHFRLVDPPGHTDLLNRFEGLVSRWMEDNAGFEVLEGKSVKEVRPHGLDKGTALRRVLEELGVDDVPVMAMGDDRTDEDMFRSLKDGDLSVLVGAGKTSAAVRLRDVWEARDVLKGILNGTRKQTHT